MTGYPEGHQGYKGRIGDQGDDDGFVSFEEVNKRRVSKGAVMLGLVIVSLAGAGLAYQLGALDDLIAAVKKNETVKKLTDRGPKGTVINDTNDKEDPDDLKVRPKKGEVIREIALDPVERKALKAPIDDDDMKGTFQYIDKKGVVHIVDHYTEVPKRYRKKAVRLEL